MQEYEQRLVARQAAMASGGGSDGGGASALPEGLKLEDAAVLAEPGKRSGQIVVVRENGAAVAYSWDAARCVVRAVASETGFITTGGRVGSGGVRRAQRRERGRLRERRRPVCSWNTAGRDLRFHCGRGFSLDQALLLCFKPTLKISVHSHVMPKTAV